MNKLVVFDIDGVLAEFEPRLVSVLDDNFGEVAYINRHLFSFEERWADYPYVLEFVQDFVADPNSYYTLLPNVAAVSFLDDLQYADYPIMYVSSRPRAAERFTRMWLEAMTENYHGTFGLFCGVTDKADFLGDLDIEFVVEDSPYQIAKLKRKGIPTLCWAQEWNEGIFPRLVTERSSEIVYLWDSESSEEIPFLWSSKKITG